jgi:NMD protein affecting ribosome stability and mRNA decay
MSWPNTNNARIPWRDYRNGRIIRSHIRNSDLLYQQQPAVTKSNAKSNAKIKTSSRSQQTKITTSVAWHACNPCKKCKNAKNWLGLCLSFLDAINSHGI